MKIAQLREKQRWKAAREEDYSDDNEFIQDTRFLIMMNICQASSLARILAACLTRAKVIEI